jgi:hypothetical protein
METMADIVLSVPLVGQQTGNHGQPLVQPGADGVLRRHGSMACWYAAAEMVSYHFRPGPRNGLPHVWKPDRGLSVAAIDELAAAEGLKRVRPLSTLTRDGLHQLLTLHGPLWAAGRFLDGHPSAGHVIVLTGVRGSVVLYNDPWEPLAKQRPCEWILQHLLPLPNALLAKDQRRS